jgi:hypothetical protein
MTRLLRLALPALALSFVCFATPEALALGDLPKFPPDRGTVPTPGPIAGGGIVWLIAVAGAGVYLLFRRGKSD